MLTETRPATPPACRRLLTVPPRTPTPAPDGRSADRAAVLDRGGLQQDHVPVARGSAELGAEAIERPEPQPTGDHRHDALLKQCERLRPLPTAVVHPCNESSLRAAVEAAHAGLIEPVLVGPACDIALIAIEHGLDISGLRVVDADGAKDAAEASARLARDGEVQALMKGALHTDELMAAVMRRENALRSAPRISHVFVMHVPGFARTLLITDAAINISPSLEDKVHIVQNAIHLAQVLGVQQPKVAILSAIETVNPKIPSTLEAAVLCKMAERGQISGGVLDGPLAFDNAISAEAARIKGIRSPVAGAADILLVPDLVAGNMLAKQLTFLANADAAGIVLGARVPVILGSRADSLRSRLASCATAALLADARRGAE